MKKKRKKAEDEEDIRSSRVQNKRRIQGAMRQEQSSELPLHQLPEQSFPWWSAAQKSLPDHPGTLQK